MTSSSLNDISSKENFSPWYFCSRSLGNCLSSSLPGSRLVAVTSGSETSTLTLDSAVRASRSAFTDSAPLRPGGSDASKVTCAGAGLSKASVGQKVSFSVDCSKAGEKSNSLEVLDSLC